MLCSVDQVRALECAQISAGRPAQMMMENAGSAAFQLLRQCWPHAERIAVYCGGGNNGGDGYVLARLASASGFTVNLVALAPPSTPEARGAKERAQGAGVCPIEHSRQLLETTDVVVDALLGIGVQGALREPFAFVISEINQYATGRLAIDVPSGLSADSGAVESGAVEADVTITFIRHKRGMVTGFGPDHCGRVVLEDLDVASGVLAGKNPLTPWGYRISKEWVEGMLPTRPASAHKGVAGGLLIIGGGVGMTGAPVLAGRAALRSGAGRVTIGCHPDNQTSTASHTPELMVVGLRTPRQLKDLLARSDAVVIGPGLGQDAWAREVYSTSRDYDVRKVLDADALNLLAARPVEVRSAVLTPHPGEAGRLGKMDTSKVQGNRPAVAETLAAQLGEVCVLKGAGTLVAQAQKPTLLCDRGHPGMATAGMGDVLSGVIGALMAQGLPGYEAAGAGVWMHSVAAERAGKGGGRIGLLATDLEPHLNELRTAADSAEMPGGR